MTDIIIGAADLYSWNQIKPWVLSIKESGFDGEIWLIAYRVEESELKQVEAHGVNVYKVDHDQYLRPIQHAQPGTPTQAHNLRFFHAWELLTRLDTKNYRFAIMTDVRDVIFQRNPSNYLGNLLMDGNHFIAPSEGITFGEEEWNKQNLIAGHGPVVYEQGGYDTRTAFNVGTIAGYAFFMRRLFYLIYTMTCGRHYPSDQSSFNVLVHDVLQEDANSLNMDSGWAAQLGTTHDPTKSWLWDRCHNPRPVIDGDVVKTTYGQEFVIVHQWDRVPHLKEAVLKRYGV